jgi:hypothetical protein
MTNTWKPIESAPKDGTFILAKCKGTFVKGKAYVPAVVCWKHARWIEIDDEARLGEGESWELGLWMELPPSEDGLEYATARCR